MIFDIMFTDDEDLILGELQVDVSSLYSCLHTVLEAKWPEGTASISINFAREE